MYFKTDQLIDDQKKKKSKGTSHGEIKYNTNPPRTITYELTPKSKAKVKPNQTTFINRDCSSPGLCIFRTDQLMTY